MLLSTSLIVGLLAYSQAATPAVPWPPGCPSECFLSGLETRVRGTAELLAQAEDSIIKARSDCCCKVRKNSLTIDGLFAIVTAAAILEYPPATKQLPISIPITLDKSTSQNVPELCSVESFKKVFGGAQAALKDALTWIKALKAGQGRNLARCEQFKNSVDSALIKYWTLLPDIIELIGDCTDAPCDPRGSDTCLPPCDSYGLAKWYLEKSRPENARAQNEFALAGPDSCCNCCWAQQAHVALSEAFYRQSGISLGFSYLVASDQITSNTKTLLTDFPMKEMLQSAPDLSKVSYNCLASTLASSPAIINIVDSLTCTITNCVGDGAVANYTTPLITSYGANGNSLKAYGIALVCEN